MADNTLRWIMSVPPAIHGHFGKSSVRLYPARTGLGISFQKREPARRQVNVSRVEFILHEARTSGLPSLRGVLGDNSPALPLRVKGEARSETQPDQGGEHHRASWLGE